MVLLGCEERDFIEKREKRVSNVVVGFMVGWLSFSWWSMVRKDKERRGKGHWEGSLMMS